MADGEQHSHAGAWRGLSAPAQCGRETSAGWVSSAAAQPWD